MNYIAQLVSSIGVLVLCIGVLRVLANSYKSTPNQNSISTEAFKSEISKAINWAVIAIGFSIATIGLLA